MLKMLLSFTSVVALQYAAVASAQTSRDILPVPQAPFAGTIGPTIADSVPSWPSGVQAPKNAPNVLLILTDDVGFGASSTFGGPVPTPNLDRLAQAGVRYNRFHTTALCSPTRAALLTGRNHQSVGIGTVEDTPTGFPGYDGLIPPSAATVAETLKLNGYNTAMFGKHHDTPDPMNSAAGPFNLWPTGLGFEYFFGFVAGDADQWNPNLFRGTNHLPAISGPPVLLDTRLADDAISWVHNQKAAAPDKPFFIYFAPGSLHAPHQAPKDWIAKFDGQFTEGWDQLRQETYQRQLRAGIIPPNAQLTPRPVEIAGWNSLPEKQKAYAIKSMQVAAAALAFQDHEIGRILDELQRMGQLENTLVIFVEGDNGASGEGGPLGTVNEIGGMVNRLGENTDWLAANLDKLGGPETYENYPVGWAWALDAPFQWTKQYASFLGGIRNGMVMSWPGHVAAQGTICSQFGHVVDVAPTILQAAGVPAPKMVNGIEQKPFDGESLLSSLSSCEPQHPRTQYFEMGGKISLYENGWFLSSDDGRKPWQDFPPISYDENHRVWQLYNLDTDYSQSTDLAARYPERVAAMRVVWDEQAKRNNVYPIDSRFGFSRPSGRGEPLRRERRSFDYWGKDTSVAFGVAPNFAGRSYTLDADIRLNDAHSSGVVVADGSHFGGWSLYIDAGRPTFVYALSTNPQHITRLVGATTLQQGPSKIRLIVKSEGGVASPATVEMVVNGAVVGTARIPQTMLRVAGNGEMLDIGHDSGAPVTDYPTEHGEIDGDVSHVALRFDD